VFLVEGRQLQKLSYLNVSLPVPTKLGFDEVLSYHVCRKHCCDVTVS